MDNGLIPYRYAKALYKYALEQGKTSELYDVAKAAIASFEKNPGLSKVMSNPFVSNADKEKLLLAAAGSGADAAYDRFIKLVIEHRREEFAYSMMLAYRDIYRKENHISQARIVTATNLDKALSDKLKALVTKSFQGTTLEFTESVNPDLIGGFVIDVDSVRMDASVSNELEQLRQTLLRSK